jgi:hypothetical protein
MKYSDFKGAGVPKLQLGQVTESLQNGRIHKIQARKIAPDGTVLGEGIVGTFIPLDEIDVTEDGTVTNAQLSANGGKWLVKAGQSMNTDDLGDWK